MYLDYKGVENNENRK